MQSELDKILKPLKSLRGVTTEESTRLQRLDFEEARQAIQAIINRSVVEASQQTLDIVVKNMNGLELAWREYRGSDDYQKFSRKYLATLTEQGEQPK